MSDKKRNDDLDVRSMLTVPLALVRYALTEIATEIDAVTQELCAFQLVWEARTQQMLADLRTLEETAPNRVALKTLYGNWAYDMAAVCFHVGHMADHVEAAQSGLKALYAAVTSEEYGDVLRPRRSYLDRLQAEAEAAHNVMLTLRALNNKIEAATPRPEQMNELISLWRDANGARTTGARMLAEANAWCFKGQRSLSVIAAGSFLADLKEWRAFKSALSTLLVAKGARPPEAPPGGGPPVV